jgi:hypothetical protein
MKNPWLMQHWASNVAPHSVRCSWQSGRKQHEAARPLRADIVASPKLTGANFLAVKKIRPTTADRCGPNHVTEVASEFIFRQ